MKPLIYDLYNDEGPVLLIRGDDPKKIYELARDHTADQGRVLIDTPETIRIDNIHTYPCNPNGHEDFPGWCDGDMRVHYRAGIGGRGSFSGAFVEIQHRTAEEWAEIRRAGQGARTAQ